MINITLPSLTPAQFGQMVLKLSEQPVPGNQAAFVLALQHMAQGLIEGSLVLVRPEAAGEA